MKRTIIQVMAAAALLLGAGFAADPKDKFDRAGEKTDRAIEKAGDATGDAVGAVVEHGSRGTVTAAKATGRAIKKAGGAIGDFFTDDVDKDYEERVRSAQTKLKSEGFYDGPVDGVPGERTRKALKNYQTREGLEPTGRINAKTAEKLGI